MPRVDTVEMLARALAVSAGWLAFAVGSPSLLPIAEAKLLGVRPFRRDTLYRRACFCYRQGVSTARGGDHGTY